MALVQRGDGPGGPSQDKKTRGGFDVNIMTRALALANSSAQRNAEEDAHASAGSTKRQTKGKLYAWGSGDFGRLGHGDNLAQKQARLIEILRDKNVRKFTCGARHSLALTLGAHGAPSVYSWGFGGEGQLGHGDFQIQTLPLLIKVLEGEGVRDIACGEKHCLALTQAGDVYAWGDGSLGQLGLGDYRKQHTPRRVMELQGRRIIAISAGAHHSACIADDHSVYSWGAGSSGRLGLGDELNICVPTLVESLQVTGAP